MDIRELLTERASTHGHFPETAAAIQHTKDWWRAQRNWSALTHAQREALDMIAHKVGRILAGDPNHLDSYVDISGYATLCVQELETRQNITPEQRRDYSKGNTTRSLGEILKTVLPLEEEHINTAAE